MSRYGAAPTEGAAAGFPPSLPLLSPSSSFLHSYTVQPCAPTCEGIGATLSVINCCNSQCSNGGLTGDDFNECKYDCCATGKMGRASNSHRALRARSPTAHPAPPSTGCEDICTGPYEEFSPPPPPAPRPPPPSPPPDDGCSNDHVVLDWANARIITDNFGGYGRAYQV